MNEVDTGNDCVQTYASRIATGDWRLATGDWRLATGDWRLATGDWRLATARRHPHRCADMQGSLRTIVHVEPPKHPVDAAVFRNVLLGIEVPSPGQGRVLGDLP
ncbi:hypothetical protein ABZ722_33030 [Streptomyces longwoodensis]|uniref:hypothetical protein n=1 Tax=Streptomyces longwoodensis TaxID=68231 RepID=UPI0033DB0E53